MSADRIFRKLFLSIFIFLSSLTGVFAQIEPEESGEGPPEPPDYFNSYKYDCRQGNCYGGDCEAPDGTCVPGYFFLRYCRDNKTICRWPNDCSATSPVQCIPSDNQLLRARRHREAYYEAFEEHSDVYLRKHRGLHERFMAKIRAWKKRSRLAKSNNSKTTLFNENSRVCPNGSLCPPNRACKPNNRFASAKYICLSPGEEIPSFQNTVKNLYSDIQLIAKGLTREMGTLATRNGMSPFVVQVALWTLLILVPVVLISRLISLAGNLFQHNFSRSTLEKLDIDDIPLLIRRSQYRTFPLYRVMFCMDVRASISPESWALIRKYRLKNLIVYGSQSFNDLNMRAIANLDIADALNKSGMPFNPLRIFSVFNGLRLSSAARFALNIRVKHLIRGKKVKSKNLFEVAEAEKIAIKACKSLHNMLILAETYDGREVVYKMTEIQLRDTGK